MTAGIFKPRKIIDPTTGKERILSPEEQENLLKNGIFFDIPSSEVTETKPEGKNND